MCKKTIFAVLLGLVCCPVFPLTLNECYSLAKENYPAIKQYDLISKSRNFSFAAASEDWIPKITVEGSVSYMSNVPTLPQGLVNSLGTGVTYQGMNQFQYLLTADITQTLFDGGVSQSKKQQARLRQEELVKEADVQFYALNNQINELYFALLLLEEQLNLNTELVTLLQENVDRVRLMLDEGVVMPSDVNAIEAEVLIAKQGRVQVESSLKAYKSMLEMIIGKEVTELEVPQMPLQASGVNNRPELDLFDLRIQSAETANDLAQSISAPKIALFAKAFYGNVGLDLFDNMINRGMKFNYFGGVSVKWNVDNIFRKNGARKGMLIEKEGIELEKELFLFNSSMLSMEQQNLIDSKRLLLEQDMEIIKLRKEVRLSSEKKLENGVADISELIQCIAQENSARTSAAQHRIELVKHLYELKAINNN